MLDIQRLISDCVHNRKRIVFIYGNMKYSLYYFKSHWYLNSKHKGHTFKQLQNMISYLEKQLKGVLT